jgi:hypothetical protein
MRRPKPLKTPSQSAPPYDKFLIYKSWLAKPAGALRKHGSCRRIALDAFLQPRRGRFGLSRDAVDLWRARSRRCRCRPGLVLILHGRGTPPLVGCCRARVHAGSTRAGTLLAMLHCHGRSTHRARCWTATHVWRTWQYRVDWGCWANANWELIEARRPWTIRDHADPTHARVRHLGPRSIYLRHILLESCVGRHPRVTVVEAKQGVHLSQDFYNLCAQTESENCQCNDKRSLAESLTSRN